MESDIGLKIQDLVRDPDQTETKPDRHKYYKKPGRGHNRDTCDACGDVGDIVCCDTCPASFHWDCVDPPLEEDDLPVGGWQCRKCLFLKKKDVESKSGGAVKQVEMMDVESQESVERIILRKGVKTVILELKKQNPSEFKLPASYGIIEPKLPGLCKPVPKKTPLRNKNVIVEPEPNNKKRAIVVCYACDQSNRIGALIACDFCNAHYHLDCLDPPLTVAPSGLWNCPLHPEPMMESKYLNSSSLSERTAIWDYTKAPLDPMTVTLNFMSKAHRSGPAKLSEKRSQLKPITKVPYFLVDAYNGFRKKYEKGVTVDLEQPGTSSATVNQQKARNAAATSSKVVNSSHRNQTPHNGLELLAEASEIVEAKKNVVDVILKGLPPDSVKELAANKLMEDPLALVRMKQQGRFKFTVPDEKEIKKKNSPVPAAKTADAATGTEEAATGTEEAETETAVESKIPLRRQPKPEYCVTLICNNNGIKMSCYTYKFDIGTGPNVLVNLNQFGVHCDRISARHATMFHFAGCWEIINYGETGTYVNGCLYGNDVSVYARQNKPRDEILRKFKEIVDERRNTLAHERQNTLAQLRNLRMEEETNIDRSVFNCLCRKEVEPLPKNCWEGSATLRNGDVIRFGCISITVQYEKS